MLARTPFNAYELSVASHESREPVALGTTGARGGITAVTPWMAEMADRICVKRLIIVAISKVMADCT